jgi:hypothetical protein
MGKFQRNEQNEVVYVVEEGEERTERFQTASWYKLHELKAGIYPVDFTTIDFRPVKSLEDAYWVMVRKIPSIVVDSSFPSRLLTATSAGPKHVDHVSTYSTQTYGYWVRDQLDQLEVSDGVH